jgi:hypothetical protein
VKTQAPIEAGIISTLIALTHEIAEVIASQASGADATTVKIRVAPEITE